MHVFVIRAHLLIEIPQCLPLTAGRQPLRNPLLCLPLSSLLLLACSCVCRAFITFGSALSSAIILLYSKWLVVVFFVAVVSND